MANQSTTMAGVTKSLLLGTTALAAVAVAPVAQAADPLKLSLGGFAEYYLVARSQRPLNDDGAGPITLIGKIKIVADPTQ